MLGPGEGRTWRAHPEIFDLSGRSAVATGAARGIGRAAALELARAGASVLGPEGVRAKAVAPGFILGHMSARLVLGSDDDLDDTKLRALADRARESTPLGIEGRPEDVAHAVLYLATEASRYVTGQVLHPNGGTFIP